MLNNQININIFLTIIFGQIVHNNIQLRASMEAVLLFQRTKKFSKQLSMLLKQGSFDAICLKSKEIALQFNRLQNHFAIAREMRTQIKNQLDQAARSIQTILLSLEFDIYGHIYSLLESLVVQYTSINKQKRQPIDPNLVLKRQETNQKSHVYKSLNLDAFDTNIQDFIQSQKFTKYLAQVAQSKITIMDSQCVFCSKVFIKNNQIKNANPFYPNVIGLSQKQSSNKINLEKHICALFNAGGGALILGAEKKGKKLMAIGMKFKDFNQLMLRKKEVVQIIQYIRPKHFGEYSVQHVLVHHNQFGNQDAAQEFMRFCIRIAIIPNERQKIKFIEINNKGYHSLYEVYEFNPQDDPTKVLHANEEENLYWMMLRRYWQYHRLKKYKLRQNIHPHIICYQPSNQYSQTFLEYADKNPNILQEKVPAYPFDEEQEQLRLPYSNSTILIVGSKNKDRFIKDLTSYMKSKKYIFDIFKPFQNQFKEGMRSIWLLSHNDKIQVMKNAIKQCDNTGNITAIPVYKTIQIDRSKLSYEDEQQIRRTYCKKFPEPSFNFSEIQKTDLNGDKKWTVNITVDSNSQVIYAYMIFQSLQLRPYLVKQNTSYKKKSKVKAY